MKEEDEKHLEVVTEVVATEVPWPRSLQLDPCPSPLKTEKEKATADAQGSSPREIGGPCNDRLQEEEEFRRLMVVVAHEVQRFLVDVVAVVPQNAAERRVERMVTEAMAMAGAMATASRIVRDRAHSPLGQMPEAPQRAQMGLLPGRDPGLGRGPGGQALTPQADLVTAPDLAPAGGRQYLRGPQNDRLQQEEERQRLMVAVAHEVQRFLGDLVAVVPQNAAERRVERMVTEAMAMAGAMAIASRIVRERAANGRHRHRRRRRHRAKRGLRAKGPGLGRGHRGHAVSPEADLVAAPDMAPESDLVPAPELDPEPEWITVPELDPEADMVAEPELDSEPEWVTVPELDPAPDSVPA